MSFTEKFQAGENYGEARKGSSNIFSDPLKLATDILKDYSGVRSQVSVKELAAILQGLSQKGEPLDDKKGYV
jgi:hypothetical protein